MTLVDDYESLEKKKFDIQEMRIRGAKLIHYTPHDPDKDYAAYSKAKEEGYKLIKKTEILDKMIMEEQEALPPPPEPLYIMDHTASVLCYRPENQVITMISPDYFLAMATSPLFSETSLEILEDRMKKGLPLDPVFFDFNYYTGEVIGHEGRHRSLVARKLGIKYIPILLFCRDMDEHLMQSPEDYNVFDLEPEREG